MGWNKQPQLVDTFKIESWLGFKGKPKNLSLFKYCLYIIVILDSISLCNIYSRGNTESHMGFWQIGIYFLLTLHHEIEIYALTFMWRHGVSNGFTHISHGGS